ncbi:hypothetical protein SAMN02745249_00171 [Atopostipes suicloacalis DSM 15692]|uniref:Glycerol acyltransferase n=1 Tax=Atopostipes suicloacalis DSM 15692 TaxID=1121025 RepID=A0A1M4SGE2_9LACT|nr:hypothetical protein [Atopostipes suicloacalis]SHE31266.1 hypothetical protein SAMN02745249_00171 [Atopostipes suicloacalis DSM 15692]
MKKRRYGLFFEIARALARVILPRFRFKDILITNEPAVYIAHHQNMIGPVSILVWIKYYFRTWVLSAFTSQKDCYEHYINYTFTKRYNWPSPIAKIVAWPLSYIVPWMMKSARAIPVYRGSRKIMDTFKISVDALLNNEDILIFPDIDYSDDSTEVSDIYEGFLHLEKYYYRETKKHLAFVPVYSNKEKREVHSGKPIRFTGDKKFIEERKEVAQKIQEELNWLSKI